MQKSLAIFLILFFVNKETKADCNPAFTVNVQGATVQVQATNTAPHLFHWWNFNGALRAGVTASYTYYQPGTYTVTHHVEDSLGNCQDSVQQTIVVDFQVICTANFTAVRDSIQPYLYHLYSTSLALGGANQINWTSWSIDGAQIALGTNFDCFLSVGNHTVCVTINTTAGCTLTKCDTIQVPPCTLNASFTYSAGSNPKQISFTAGPAPGASVYTWLFGDGYSSTQQNPTHTYTQPGSYNVTLRIYCYPCYDTIIQNIVVHGSPSDSCTASYTYEANPTRPSQITFTATSNQTITSQIWWINDLNDPYDSVFITANNPTYTFTDTGYYWVCLYVTTNTGCTRSYCNYIYISTFAPRLANVVPSYPNPANSSVSFDLKLTEQKKISITVYNQSGYAVYKTEKQGHAGSNRITVPVQQLNSGQYFIDIKYGDQQKRSIFQKL